MQRRTFFQLAALPLATAAGEAAPAAESVAHFQSARPVWPGGRETEMNVTVRFRTAFSPATGARLRLAASTIYRAFAGGTFLGCGPARGPHGYYRADEWELPAGCGEVVIEVAGYNSNSYYLLDQPSFLQAEIVVEGRVLSSTEGEGVRFAARIAEERVQKVQRYSFQRPFSEVYRLAPNQAGTPATLSAMPAKRLLPRGVGYPDFSLRQPVYVVAAGRVIDTTPAKYYRDRSLTAIGPQLKGFPERELAEIPSLDLQRFKSEPAEPLMRPYAPSEKLAFEERAYQILDFGVNLTGFPGALINVSQPATVYLTFDEMLTNGDVNPNRLGSVNILTYHLEPGTYAVESFEPYTLRYLKILVAKGRCTATNITLREYTNPDVWTAGFAASDPGLNQLFAAGRETYRQNCLDIFMDCPSRERAGWLCDSYFTARVEHRLTGRSRVEMNFLENFQLVERFEHLPEGMLPMCYPSDHNDGVFIPNWSLWFVMQLEEYLARSGDRKLVDALRPRVLALFDYFKPFRNSDGLLEKLKGWVFIEWSNANKFVQDVNYPSNMLYAAALDAAGRLYSLPALSRDAAAVRNAVRRQSFDGTFFVDNAVREAGKLRVTNNRSETCQYYAFHLGTATPESHPDLWRTLVEKFGPERRRKGLYPDVHPANAFIGNMLRLELLSRHGLAAQLVEESEGYLLYMAERSGTLWEHDKPSASLNHGFASHIVNALYRDVLGLYQVDTITKTVDVRFSNVALEWCEGRVPVPGGIVSLAWRKRGGNLSYDLQAPAGYRVKLQNASGMKVEAR